MARVARIPQIQAGQGLDTQRSTQPNIQIDMSPYQAASEMAQTVQGAARHFYDRYTQQQQEMQAYKTERAFQKFQNDTLMDATQYEQEADQSGENFLKNYGPRFDQKLSEFESNVPENLRDQYGPKIENFRGRVTLDMAQKEVGIRNKYYEFTLDTDVGGLTTTIRQNPSMSDNAWSTIEANVNMSGLSSIKKAEKLQIYRKALNEATVKGYSDRGEFDKARDFIQHLGPAPAVIPHGTGKKGTGPKIVVYEHVDYTRVKPQVKAAIASVSSELGIQLDVTSGYRGLKHPSEKNKGPKALHRHTTGTAVDLNVAKYSQDERAQIVKSFMARGITGIGVYENSPNMIHVDWSGLGAGVKETGISGWFGKESLFEGPVWFTKAVKEGLESRKGGSPTFTDPNSAGSNVRPLEEGNINLFDRPRVKNADGSISTVRSISFEEDGREILVPTVSDDGRIMSNDEAVRQYKKTGRHLGKFKNAGEATAYAKSLHDQQDQVYNTVPNRITEDDWTLRNFDAWEFGTDPDVDASVGAALDNMTDILGKKLAFKFKDDSIKINVAGISDEEKILIVQAAQAGGFNSFEEIVENKNPTLVLRTKGDVKSSPAWITKNVPKPEKNYVEIAGPNSDFVPRGSPDADELEDYVRGAEEKRERDTEKATKDAQNEKAKEGWGLVHESRLDDQWLEDNVDGLSEVDYRMFVKHLAAEKKAKAKGKEEKPYEKDQKPYVDLMRRAINPKDTEVVRDAIEAQSRNLISKTDFNQVFETYDKGVREGALGKPTDWKPIIRKYVVDKIIKNPDDPEDTKYLDDRMGALMELDDFMKEHPDATRNQVMAEAQNLLKKYNGSANEDRRANLPMTALPGVGRYDKITPAMLKSAAQKVESDFKNSLITKEIRAARIKELTDWFNLVNDEMKNGQ